MIINIARLLTNRWLTQSTHLQTEDPSSGVLKVRRTCRGRDRFLDSVYQLKSGLLGNRRMKRLNSEEIAQCECVVESANRALHNFPVMTHFSLSALTAFAWYQKRRFVTQTGQVEAVQEKFLKDLLKAHRTTVLGQD